MLGVEIADRPPVRKLNRWSRKMIVRGEEWQILRSWDLQPDEKILEDRFRIRAEIGRWCRTPLLWAPVLSMYQKAYRADPPVKPRSAGVHWLEEKIAAAFQNQVLVVVVRQLWKPGPAAESDSGSSTATALEPRRNRNSEDKGRTLETPKKTWVEIKLVDQDGNVVPNEHYRITLPDGTVKDGVLDEDGWMRESGIDPGECTITFPDIHDREWDPI